MRVLVVGPSTTINTSLACHVLKSTLSSEHWNVITSYQTSLDAYRECPNVQSVTAFKDLKDGEEQPNAAVGLVLEVLATSFFERPWVKQRLREDKKLLVVSSSPVTSMDKSVLEKFDRIYITKTAAADKQSQYYTLFVDTVNQSFTDFKKTIKNIATNQYAVIALTDGKPGKMVVESYTAAWEVPSSGVGAERKGAAPPLMTEGHIRAPPGNDDTVERPNEATKAGCVELWLTLNVKPDVPLDDVVANLRSTAMLGNDIIASMLHKCMCSKVEAEHRLNVYLEVIEQRQDLFVSLAMNMLLSFRLSNIISRGSLVV